MYLKFELWFMLVLFMNSQFWGGIPRNRRVLCRGQIPWNSQSFYSWESLSGFLVKLLVKIVFIQQILPRVLFLLLQVWWTKAKKAVLSIRKLATNLDAIFYNFESIGGSGCGNVPVDMRFIVWYNRMIGGTVLRKKFKNHTNSLWYIEANLQSQVQRTRCDFVYFGVDWTVLQWLYVEFMNVYGFTDEEKLWYRNVSGCQQSQQWDINWLLWWVKPLAIDLTFRNNVYLICLTIFVCLFHVQNIKI